MSRRNATCSRSVTVLLRLVYSQVFQAAVEKLAEREVEQSRKKVKPRQ